MINQELLDLRYRIRHSAAHVMADVVTKMFPEAKLAIGPPTEDGFYYDFLSEKPFTEEDLEAIESEMRKIIQDDHQFIYSEYVLPLQTYPYDYIEDEYYEHYNMKYSTRIIYRVL